MIFLPAAFGIVSWLVAVWVLPLLVPQPACEGYWPDAEVCLDLGSTRPSRSRRSRANTGCPQWRINQDWAGRAELSAKLHEIEAVAKEWEQLLEDGEDGDVSRKPPVWIRRERGLAWSRIEEGVMAGNSEFHTDWGTQGHVCWTDALLPMYIDTFGVEPSKRFKEFVADFRLQEFRLELEKVKIGSQKSN
jgi:hypothetical protein